VSTATKGIRLAPGKATHWSLAASAGSILSAFLASTCCIGPLLLALLGISGASLLLPFKRHQPYFVALTFLLVGTSLFLTYRSPRAGEDAECACPAPRASVGAKLLIWLATVLALAFLALPFLAPVVFG
jgi:mercuric ion transport protein